MTTAGKITVHVRRAVAEGDSATRQQRRRSRRGEPEPPRTFQHIIVHDSGPLEKSHFNNGRVFTWSQFKCTALLFSGVRHHHLGDQMTPNTKLRETLATAMKKRLLLTLKDGGGTCLSQLRLLIIIHLMLLRQSKHLKKQPHLPKQEPAFQLNQIKDQHVVT